MTGSASDPAGADLQAQIQRLLAEMQLRSPQQPDLPPEERLRVLAAALGTTPEKLLRQQPLTDLDVEMMERTFAPLRDLLAGAGSPAQAAARLREISGPLSQRFGPQVPGIEGLLRGLADLLERPEGSPGAPDWEALASSLAASVPGQPALDYRERERQERYARIAKKSIDDAFAGFSLKPLSEAGAEE